MTKQQLLSDNDFSGKLVLPHGYELYTIYKGGDKLHYYFFGMADELIFSGNDYRPSPLYPAIDSVEAVVGCLSFLTLQDGATDREYFANYTPAQLAFRDSYACEELNGLINDFEEFQYIAKDDEIAQEYCKAAKDYFYANYTQEIAK